MRNDHNIGINKKLIIGKNSKIVKSLSLDDSFDIISHLDVEADAFTNYTQIYIFSWYKNQNQRESFERLLLSIEPSKLVFISTIAVDSLQIRKQWNFYPNHKKYFEEITQSVGGSVIRIGIYENNKMTKLFGPIPITSREQLKNALSLHLQRGTIYHCYSIINLKTKGIVKYSSQILHWASLKLTNFNILNKIVQGVAKSVGLSYYGYTADCLSLYADKLLIGKGILGSTYLEYCNTRNEVKCIASNLRDVTLNDNGFKNTLIGKTHGGLGHLWHGVFLKPSNHIINSYRKIVPLFVRRPLRNGRLHENLNVNSVYFDLNSEIWKIECINKYGQYKIIYSNKLILAAGPLENTRLLSKLTNASATLCDHEIGMVGTCSKAEAIAEGYINKKQGLLLPGLARKIQTFDGIEFLVDIRPHVPTKHIVDDGINFYIASNISIVKKILINFNIFRINEAFFNKFGVGFPTERMSVFVQALSRDCILAQPSTDNGSFYLNLKRTRLSEAQWNSIKSIIKSNLISFAPDAHTSSIDALHIMGAENLMQNNFIQKLCSMDKLRILGSPTTCKLDSTHHTMQLISSIRRGSPILIVCLESYPENSPHYEHCLSIANYHGNDLDVISTNFWDSIIQIRNFKTIYFQKSSILNIFLLAYANILGKKCVLYIHEPLKLRSRIRKGVPLFKSLKVSAFHYLETVWPDKLLTGNEINKHYFRRRLVFAPLLYSEQKESPCWTRRKSEVLYFGRLDTEKFFYEFLSFNFNKKIIATFNLNVKDVGIPISRVSSEEKNNIFMEHKYIWCSQKNNFSQSGVLLDAIRFGCVAIICESDPVRNVIGSSHYVALPLGFTEKIILELIKAYEKLYPSGPLHDGSFSRLGGSNAFERYWRDNFVE